MAENKPKNKPASIGAFLPKSEIGQSLEDSGIENIEVTIVDVGFENRRGANGDYTLTTITLDDGTLIHTGSPVVAEQLGAVNPRDWPLRAMFVRIRSQRNPRYSYWSVIDPDSKPQPM